MNTADFSPLPLNSSDNPTPLDPWDPLNRQLAEINRMRVYPLTLEELRQLNAGIDEYWEAID